MAWIGLVTQQNSTWTIIFIEPIPVHSFIKWAPPSLCLDTSVLKWPFTFALMRSKPFLFRHNPSSFVSPWAPTILHAECLVPYNKIPVSLFDSVHHNLHGTEFSTVLQLLEQFVEHWHEMVWAVPWRRVSELRTILHATKWWLWKCVKL